MFFFLSKVLSFLLDPICWVFALLLGSLFFKDAVKKRRSFFAALLCFYFFSNAFILEEFTRIWEVPATPYAELDTCDAGIVLGGMLTLDKTLDRIQFERGADRLFQAIELYKKGYIRKIFFVGGSGSLEFNDMKEGMTVKRYLLTIGIPESDIWIENESRNTRENALNSKKILVDNGNEGGKFLLITSGMHMRRSMACFKKVGLHPAPYSVDRQASPVRRFTLDHLLIPNAQTLVMWDALIHEWVGMIVYKVKGYA